MECSIMLFNWFTVLARITCMRLVGAKMGTFFKFTVHCFVVDLIRPALFHRDQLNYLFRYTWHMVTGDDGWAWSSGSFSKNQYDCSLERSFLRLPASMKLGKKHLSMQIP